MRALTTLLLALVCFLALPGDANAGPGASGSISTKNGAKGSGSGFDWPEVVYGGNAISLLTPFQIGVVNYMPRGRFSFQYDRQILKGHWFFLGASVLFDRANWKTFKMDGCGIAAPAGKDCSRAGVVGFDVYAGYTYKFYVHKRPYVVPLVRGAIGYGLFSLPRVGKDDPEKLQSRARSQMITVKPGGGFRLFLLPELGIGSDINLPIGVLIHRDLIGGGATIGRDTSAEFLFGVELMLFNLEYRF